MSLSRLRLRQGKHAEARQLLAAVYNWFTEEFETADLQEARMLLAELALVKGRAVSREVDPGRDHQETCKTHWSLVHCGDLDFPVA